MDGVDVTVAEEWEGDLRTGGPFCGSNSPTWQLPGLPMQSSAVTLAYSLRPMENEGKAKPRAV